jgi:hypothetical protein
MYFARYRLYGHCNRRVEVWDRLMGGMEEDHLTSARDCPIAVEEDALNVAYSKLMATVIIPRGRTG